MKLLYAFADDPLINLLLWGVALSLTAMFVYATWCIILTKKEAKAQRMILELMAIHQGVEESTIRKVVEDNIGKQNL